MAAWKSLSLGPLFLAIATLCLTCDGKGQLVELREYHGKQISCVQSGLFSFGMPCGTSGYDYVFVGLVLSVTDLADDEKELVLVPEEVFRGSTGKEITAFTSQGNCLPEILPGERWIFFLQRDTKTKSFLLSYGSPSKPIQEAQKDVAMLRRQARMFESGILRGHVQSPVWHEKEQIEDFRDIEAHNVTARRVPDGTEYGTLTDKNGDYEFEPLPSGRYEVSANTAKGLWAEADAIEVQSNSCTSVDFRLYPDGMISGQIRNARGTAFRYAHVMLTPEAAEGSRFELAIADENGYFEIRGLRPGRYLMGIDIDAQQGTPQSQHRVYYPGVRSRALAAPIEIGLAEHRSNADFQVPTGHQK